MLRLPRMQLSFYLGVPYKDAVISYAKITSLMTVSYLKSLLEYLTPTLDAGRAPAAKGIPVLRWFKA